MAERADVTDAQIADGRDALRDELVNQQRDRFFSAYMAKAKTALKIDIDQDVLAQVVGAGAPATPGCRRCNKAEGTSTRHKAEGRSEADGPTPRHLRLCRLPYRLVPLRRACPLRRNT